MRVTINSLSTNSVRTETVGGRSFTVLTAMMIRSNTSMNGILYPHEELKSSFSQLEDVPAPIGHPTLMDQHVSASNNFARGKHDAGAFVKNVTMKGKEVFGEIWIDNEVASRSERGKSLLQRIASKTKIAVSTGLTIGKIIARNGVDELGKAYNSIGSLFSFDHVALLDENEQAAGQHAGTEIKFNSENSESLFVITHSGGKPDNNIEVNAMKHEIDLSDLSKADRSKVMACNAQDILAAITAEPEVTIEQAQTVIESKGLQVNSADSIVLTAEQHKELKTNADLYKTAEAERLNVIKQSIMTNSKMEASDLDGLSESALTKIANAIAPGNDFSAQETVTTNADKAGTIEKMEGM